MTLDIQSFKTGKEESRVGKRETLHSFGGGRGLEIFSIEGSQAAFPHTLGKGRLEKRESTGK